MKLFKASGKQIFRNFFIKLVLAAFLVYVAVSFIQLQVQINEKKEQLAAVESKNETIRTRNAEKEQLLDNGIDDEYKAQYARKNDYVMDNERVYKSNKAV